MADLIKQTENYQLLCVVVLFNCQVKDSKTFQSILNCVDESDKTMKVLIWNNGPVAIEHYDSGLDIDYYQSLENIALSKIYNTAIEDYDAELYLLLDQDSIFTKELFSKILLGSAPLTLPVICSEDSPLYPINLTSKDILQESKVSSISNIYSIGSGICLKKELITLFKQQFDNVFDERFVLYGVDTTFFKRIKLLPAFEVNIAGKIHHSLSRIEEKSSIPLFRKIERSYDIALQLRYYTSKNLMIVYCQYLINSIISFEPKMFTALLKGLLFGRHPRTKYALIDKHRS